MTKRTRTEREQVASVAEAQVALGTYKDLGGEYEAAVVESFVARLGDQIDDRVALSFDEQFAERLAEPGPISRALARDRRTGLAVVLTSLALGIIAIHRRVNYHSDQPPRPGQEVRNGTLTLTAGCSDCGTDYDLTVPASVALTIADKAGAITLDGVAGPIDITSGAGAVTATGLRSSSVRVEGSAGAIELGFSTAPTTVTAHSSAGGITVTVPGGPCNIDAGTKAGTPHINVADSPSAPRRLTLTSNAGSVTVNRV